MGLFSRRSKAPDTPPDDAFPFWDRATADSFRALVRTTFAEAGSEVTVYADHTVDERGTQFGLANLAATCHADERGRRAWPDLVAAHVRTIVSAMNAPSPFTTMTDAEVLAATYCRVMPTDDLLPTMGHAADVAPGLSMVFNLDLPKSVLYFPDEKVTEFGYDTLLAAGRRNLQQVPIDAREQIEHDGGHVDVWAGDSVFTASLLLDFDALMARHNIPLDPRLGAFVAVPYRHQLDFHVIRDDTAVPSLQILAGFAASAYADSPGQLSPSAYWWRPGAIERLSTLDADGLRIEVSSELGDILDELAVA